MRNGGIALAVFAAALVRGVLGAGRERSGLRKRPTAAAGWKGSFRAAARASSRSTASSASTGPLSRRSLASSGSARPTAPPGGWSSRRARTTTLSKKKLLPVFELLGTIALASPGQDGKYRVRQPNRIIRRYANEAREEKFLLMLDIQPGRSTFIEEAKHLEPWLKRSFVSIALDPEWNMGPGGVPGQRIGSVDASDGQQGDRVPVEADPRERPAAEARRDPPVHRQHGQEQAEPAASTATSTWC